MSEFELFGAEHLIATATTVVLAFALPLIVRRRAGPHARHVVRRLIAVGLLAYLIVAPIVASAYYAIPLHELLPLHLCRLTIFLGIFMLSLRSYRLYEVVYFWGTGATLAALAFPDLLAAYPHPLFLLFFVGHGLALTTVMFATLVLGFRPTLRSLGIALIVTALYAVILYPVNILLGSNYLFIMRKPAQPSPLDYFGPWPFYLIGLVAMTAVVCAMCYLPFAVSDRLRRWQRRQESI